MVADDNRQDYYFRYRLAERTERRLADMAGFDAHHTLPYELRVIFNPILLSYANNPDRRTTVNNTFWGAWWDSRSNRGRALEYSNEWREFFLANPEPSLAEIIKQNIVLTVKYQYEWPTKQAVEWLLSLAASKRRDTLTLYQPAEAFATLDDYVAFLAEIYILAQPPNIE